MISSRKLLFCLMLSFCLLNAVFSMPHHTGEEHEDDENDIELKDAPEEIPGAERNRREIPKYEEAEKELEVGNVKFNEEEELEAKEAGEKNLERKNKSDELDNKDLEEDNEDETDEIYSDKDIIEDEIVRKEIGFEEESKKEDDIVFPVSEEKEVPEDESFHENEEEITAEEEAEEEAEEAEDNIKIQPSIFEFFTSTRISIFPENSNWKGLSHPVLISNYTLGGDFDEDEKPGFFRRTYKKIKNFFKGLGK